MAPRLVGGSMDARTLVLQGRADSVADSALVSVMLGCSEDRICRGLMAEYPMPDALWRVCAEDLTAQPGVGPAAAARLLASLEMSRRWACRPATERPVISTPEDVVRICGPQFRGLDREHFWALALNTKNQLLRTVEISIGSLNASIVHPRELYKEAIRLSAASIVVVHNHPSGDPTPSGADLQLTRRLTKAGDVIGIELLDHVIIGDGGAHASVRDLGLM
ncbi:MAG: DNA repair protein RadC [Coriobacteriia bacterium]|nr:DNA repair protein RadC [Coriobacteriia bacterium]MBN2823494.1 DNA repair protein RadC [Coriobacteriia bacterium]